jgi:TetR/AcrR family transcriptional repressor of nem operon
MKYSSDQRAKAKQAILQAGAKSLRKSGFNGVGVDGLAASAGVTSGAFYSNFSNKEEFLGEVIEAYLGNRFVDPGSGSLSERQARFKDFLGEYISAAHREDPAIGCVMPSLSADVSRSNAAVRKAYQRKMGELIERMSRAMAGTPAQKEKQAWSVLAMMVGAVTIARALPDGKEANKLLKAALENAIALVDRQ